jgi:hypothetical protein
MSNTKIFDGKYGRRKPDVSEENIDSIIRVEE